MPELQPEITKMRSPGELNDAQLRRLSVTCEYIDKLLRDVEHILHEATSPSPFPRHVIDLTPAQTRVLEDHIRQIRKQLLHTLEWQHMKPEPPDIPATRALLTNLAFIDIAIEELKPSYMRGSGSVPEDAASELTGVVYELRSVVKSMERYMRQELGTNLESRLKELEQTGHDVKLLQLIEEIITRHGLVEFRARIRSLVSRLEDNNLEVALFGRVSSGKSSLLNALLGTDVLPVGVNPITAVPTRLRYGAELRAAVAYASGRDEVIPIDAFANLITEQGNPGNERNVVRALVEVPSPRLKQGIVLVDTPGLGSLAKRGAAETMAYLPACDLALLLIDAGNALNDEDIGTLRILYEGGIPALVLLSKADLLAEGDLHRVIAYMETQLQRELGISLHVHAVSALPKYEVLVDHFFERELLPRFEQARSLREASVARKIGALRESVTAALETSLHHEKRGRENLFAIDTQEADAELRRVSGEIGEQQTILDHAFLELGERPESILSELADMATARICSGAKHRITSLTLAEWTYDVVQGRVDHSLAQTRATIENAITTLQTIANKMARSDMPSREDAGALLRDAPRFEIGVIPGSVDVARWKWMGKSIVRLLIKSSLRQNLGPTLKDELHRYGNALSQWSEQMTRKMSALVNSYADAYRAQFNRIRESSPDGEISPEMEIDLGLLLHWDATENTDAKEKRA
jgi:GTP-binding protein EngB required for normal cell division